jgi:hypothetical protein
MDDVVAMLPLPIFLILAGYNLPAHSGGTSSIM